MKSSRSSNKLGVIVSIVAIALCVVLITGSTFSLFTGSTDSDIVISAGKIELTADLNDDTFALSSLGVAQPGKTFANGGTATLAGADLTLENVTPGDKAEFDIVVDNDSTVLIQYRITWTITGELAQYLVTNVDNGTSQWAEWAPITDAENTKTHHVSIELPKEVNNDAFNDSAEITFYLEAVQANATGLYSSDAYVSTADGLQAALDAGATEITLNESVELTETLVIPTAPATYSLRSTPATVIDLNGKTITAAASIADSENCALIMNRGNLVITNGTINVENATAIRNHGATANLVLENMTVTQTGSDVPSEWLASAVFTSGGATTVIENGTYTGVSSAVTVATSGGNLTINGGTFTAEKTAARVDSWSYNSVLTINDGTFNSANKALYADGYKYVTVNGGTFNATIDSTYTNIDIKGGTFNVSIKQPGGHQNYYNISGGTFVDDLSVSISNNTKVNHVVTDNGDGTYTVAMTAEEAKEMIAAGETVTLDGVFDFGGETIAIPSGTAIVGGIIKNAHLTSADDNSISFNGVTFAENTVVEAKGDGVLTFVDCTFDVAPAKYNGFSRGAAIIGANQYYTLDLYLEGCTFNYCNGTPDRWNNAIFMWTAVDSCIIKDCTFNGYGYVGIKLMNAVDGAEIVFDGNTFNMSKQGDANWYHNNAVQVMPQHDREMTVKFINNIFTGDYEDGKIVSYVEVMNGGALTNLTFEQNGNTLNGEAVTEDNFAIKAN